jgi:hypothetical protein
MRFADIDGPLSCDADSVQMTSCARVQWPNLCSQLGLCGDDVAPGQQSKGGGCGLGGFAQSGLILAVFLLIARFRR